MPFPGTGYEAGDIQTTATRISIPGAGIVNIAPPDTNRVYALFNCFIAYDTLVGGSPNGIYIFASDGDNRVPVGTITPYQSSVWLEYRKFGQLLFYQLQAQRTVAGTFTLETIIGRVTGKNLSG